jgi:hypothetical protein
MDELAQHHHDVGRLVSASAYHSQHELTGAVPLPKQLLTPFRQRESGAG